MSGKKTLPTSAAANLPALKIGSRVRCSDDSVVGRIIWANAVSVKIRWDDGEQVSWRRDSLAGRPIEIVDADDETGRPEAPAAGVGPDQPATTEAPAAEPETTPAAPEPSATELASPAPAPTGLQTAAPAAPQPIQEPLRAEAPRAAASEAGPPSPARDPTEAPTAAAGEPVPAASAKPKRRRKAPTQPREKKSSALDAAAKALAEAGHAMSCKEMIEAMAAKGYWASPGGRTPDATLYSAVAREIRVRGERARFRKAGPGRFALHEGA